MVFAWIYEYEIIHYPYLRIWIKIIIQSKLSYDYIIQKYKKITRETEENIATQYKAWASGDLKYSWEIKWMHNLF